MTQADAHILEALRCFQAHVAHAPGHGHLYEQFDDLSDDLVQYRDGEGRMTMNLAREILATIDLFLEENMVGRRPWTGNWEVYFGQCISDAHGLVKLFASFRDSAAFLPRGYCNRLLDAFVHMDRLDRQHEERYPRWSSHFAHLAALAAEMFSLFADSTARVEIDILDHPDDRVFSWLLTGYARSEATEAGELLEGYLSDDEEWVRQLAGRLVTERAKTQR